MKILADFNPENISFSNAYLSQYKKYMLNKPVHFQAWIPLPGSPRTQKEHNAFCGDIGLVAKCLNVTTEWVYWRTRTDPDCLQDAFEIEEYNQETGEYLGNRTRGLSEIDHEDMNNYKVIERFRNYWQDEIDAYESDKLGYQIHIKINWYSIEK